MTNAPVALLIIGGGAVLVWSGVVDPPGGVAGLVGAALRGEKLPTARPAATDGGLLSYVGALLQGSGGGTGTAPASYVGGPGRSAMISLARSQVGTREGANNDNPYGRALGTNHAPWCAYFLVWCAKQTGQSAAIPNTGSAPGMARAFGNRYTSGSAGIRAGDIVFYHGAENGWGGIGHVGIAVSDSVGGTWQSVEGNYGDKVALNTRGSCVGHASPNYSGGASSGGSTPPKNVMV